MGSIEDKNESCKETYKLCRTTLPFSAHTIGRYTRHPKVLPQTKGELYMASIIDNKPSLLNINQNVYLPTNSENVGVEPTFDMILPKTTTIKCVVFFEDTSIKRIFFITRYTTSEYPIFVFTRDETTKTFTLTGEIRIKN